MSPILELIGGVKGYGWGSSKIFLPSFESIATATVGPGGASNVTFSSIPSIYTHLQIRQISRSNRQGNVADGFYIQFNSDTANNYTTHALAGSYPTSVSSYQDTTQGGIIGTVASATNTAANVFGTGVIDILDYKNTNKFKTTKLLAGMEDNTYGYVQIASGNWRSTSAITSIQIFPQIGSAWNQHTHFALYGIKVSE